MQIWEARSLGPRKRHRTPRVHRESSVELRVIIYGLEPSFQDVRAGTYL